MLVFVLVLQLLAILIALNDINFTVSMFFYTGLAVTDREQKQELREA